MKSPNAKQIQRWLYKWKAKHKIFSIPYDQVLFFLFSLLWIVCTVMKAICIIQRPLNMRCLLYDLYHKQVHPAESSVKLEPTQTWWPRFKTWQAHYLCSYDLLCKWDHVKLWLWGEGYRPVAGLNQRQSDVKQVYGVSYPLQSKKGIYLLTMKRQTIP